MIDSHCHLADKQFDRDIEAVLQRAEENGVDTLIAIADSLHEAKKCLGLTEKYERVFCSVGTHPHHAKHWNKGDEKKVEAMLLSSPKAVAVGEIGLDYHYMNSPREAQMKIFETQLQLAKRLDLPAVIHNRDSWEDLWRIVQDVKPRTAVLHCCTEKWSDVAAWVEAGYLLSFTGIATYPNAGEIRETIKQCPIEKLMIETDAPYLAPIPHRGARNEPAFVVEVAKLIAGLKGISLQEVDAITTRTTVQFFCLR